MKCEMCGKETKFNLCRECKKLHNLYLETQADSLDNGGNNENS